MMVPVLTFLSTTGRSIKSLQMSSPGNRTERAVPTVTSPGIRAGAVRLGARGAYPPDRSSGFSTLFERSRNAPSAATCRVHLSICRRSLVERDGPTALASRVGSGSCGLTGAAAGMVDDTRTGVSVEAASDTDCTPKM